MRPARSPLDLQANAAIEVNRVIGAIALRLGSHGILTHISSQEYQLE